MLVNVFLGIPIFFFVLASIPLFSFGDKKILHWKNAEDEGKSHNENMPNQWHKNRNTYEHTWFCMKSAKASKLSSSFKQIQTKVMVKG